MEHFFIFMSDLPLLLVLIVFMLGIALVFGYHLWSKIENELIDCEYCREKVKSRKDMGKDIFIIETSEDLNNPIYIDTKYDREKINTFSISVGHNEGVIIIGQVESICLELKKNIGKKSIYIAINDNEISKDELNTLLMKIWEIIVEEKSHIETKDTTQ